MKQYEYRAVRVRQTPTGPWMVLFSAPATQIDQWGGIPQKRTLGERETTGFQRELNEQRLKKLRLFYDNPANIVQNPLLCASKQAAHGKTLFTRDEGTPEGYAETGTLVIEVESLETWSLLKLLKAVKTDIESRAPHLAGQPIPSSLILDIKKNLSDVTIEELPQEADHSDTDDDDDEDEGAPATEESATGPDLAFDESHILEFWQDISARAQVLEELNDESRNEIQHFTKDAMISFLLPVVVVDGQHRLRGALETVKFALKKEPYLSQMEADSISGDSAEAIQQKYQLQASRVLPISLLLDSHPAEHVFQFVVVNQKATPVGKALLGTIVSTSLSDAELEEVSQRLIDAGIPLEESRAAAFLARSPESPFHNLVERGMSTEGNELLAWTVLVSLVTIFRELKGAKLFHERTNDNAEIWRKKYLADSGIVAGWAEKGFDSPYTYWKSFDGPWRKVFTTFWTAVRDKLAKKSNSQAWHYWGAPRRSNIFNKPSLMILSADFFLYLCESKSSIDSVEHVKELVAEWLENVDSDYFNRDFKLGNQKKDSAPIKIRWSQLWVEYRRSGARLPRVELYAP